MEIISQNALELILPIVPLRFSCIYSVDLPPAVENFPVAVDSLTTTLFCIFILHFETWVQILYLCKNFYSSNRLS